MSDLIKRLRGWSKSNGAPIWEEAAALIVSLREEVARKDAENEHVAEMFVAVVEQLDDDRNQAPGHAHNIPGIWDRDNGPLAGKPCAWCALWREARNVTNAYRAARPKE